MDRITYAAYSYRFNELGKTVFTLGTNHSWNPYSPLSQDFFPFSLTWVCLQCFFGFSFVFKEAACRFKKQSIELSFHSGFSQQTHSVLWHWWNYNRLFKSRTIAFPYLTYFCRWKYVPVSQIHLILIGGLIETY